MKQSTVNNNKATSRPFGQLATGKKKTIMALCLIVIMVFMWVRVLGKKGPSSAQATLISQKTTSDQSDSQLKISYIDLPKIAGRNDILTRDFFTAGRSQSFIKSREGEDSVNTNQLSIVSKNNSDEMLELIADRLKLEAIGFDRQPQAFINGKLLTVGDKLSIENENNNYECEIVAIKENAVSIKCGEAEITLKLAQPIEVAK